MVTSTQNVENLGIFLAALQACGTTSVEALYLHNNQGLGHFCRVDALITRNGARYVVSVTTSPMGFYSGRASWTCTIAEFSPDGGGQQGASTAASQFELGAATKRAFGYLDEGSMHLEPTKTDLLARLRI